MEKSKWWLRVLLLLAVVCAIFGMSLMIAGFISPPLGIIDSSVLTGYGETLTFVGYCLGIDYTYKFKEKQRKSDSRDK